MKKPFGHVLYIERRDREPHVAVYQTFEGAEEALRLYAAGIYVSLFDEDIIEALAEDGTRVRIHAVSIDRRNNKQTSVELQPFARAKAA